MSVRKMHRDIKANKSPLYVLESELFELQQRTKHNKYNSGNQNRCNKNQNIIKILAIV